MSSFSPYLFISFYVLQVTFVYAKLFRFYLRSKKNEWSIKNN